MPKILLIEDDESLYKMYSTELEMEGYETVWHNTGIGATETAKKENPALILLDIMLPDKDGIKILKDLKEEPVTKNIPVVMLTNFGSDENIKVALETGAEDFILKYQIVPAELVVKIKQILKV
ncbi:MAG: response regulator [Patescibacteria group bacterium]|nr:response regulator [Patescibacteria group bacterium]